MTELSAPPAIGDLPVAAREPSQVTGRTHQVRAADALATAVLQAAVPLMVWQETSSVAWSGAAFAIEWAPRLAAIAAAGPQVDRRGPCRVMACVGSTRAVLVVLILAGLLSGGGGLLLLVFAAAAGVLAETGFLAAEALTADAARASRAPHRVQAFAANVDQGALLLGPVLAGCLLVAGSAVLLVAVGVISAVSAAVSLRLAAPYRPREALPVSGSGMRTGVKTLWRLPALRWVVLAAMALNTLMAVVQAVTPALVTATFGRTTAATATLWTISAAVSLAAVTVAGRAVGRTGVWTVGAGAAVIASLAGLAAAAAPSYSCYAVAVAILAAGEGAAIMFVRTVRLALIPQAAFGATTGVTILLTLLPYPAAGLLVAMVPAARLPYPVAGAAAVCAVLTAISFAALRRHHLSPPHTPLPAPSHSETPMPEESLLLIGSGAASYRGYALETLAARHRIVLLDYAAPTWQLPHIADYAVADLRDQIAVRTAVQELATRHELRGVLSWDEFAMVNAAVVARSLGLPGPDPDAVASCRDKARTRTLLDVHRVPSAQWEPVADLTGAREAGDRIGYPLVLKPASAAGSAGVVRVNHHSELADAMVFTRRATAEQGREGSGMLAESYLDGPEVSVEIVTFRGRHHVVAVTRKELGAQPYFEETGHLVVAVDPASDPASRIATAALYAVGITHGVSHVEIRRTSRGPCVVEVNPRLAGDLIPRLVALSTGVDLVGAAAELALGRMPDLTPSRAAVAGVRFLYPSTAGRVKSLSVDAGLRAETWCERAVIEQQPGALVAPPPAAGLDSRLAHVVVIGASTTQCCSRLDQAAAAVHEVIIPADLVAAGAA